MQICIVLQGGLVLILFNFVMFVCLFGYAGVTFISLVLMVDFVFITCFQAQIVHGKNLGMFRMKYEVCEVKLETQ